MVPTELGDHQNAHKKERRSARPEPLRLRRHRRRRRRTCPFRWWSGASAASAQALPFPWRKHRDVCAEVEDDNLDECGSDGVPSCRAKMQQRRAALFATSYALCILYTDTVSPHVHLHRQCRHTYTSPSPALFSVRSYVNYRTQHTSCRALARLLSFAEVCCLHSLLFSAHTSQRSYHLIC
jgi:hypothetical protein